MEENLSFGKKIRKLRLESNLTQRQLAEKLNVSFQTISKWEKDINEPDIANIVKLVHILKCSYEYLFENN